MQRAAGAKSCFAVHSLQAALRLARLPRKFRCLTACRTANFSRPGRPSQRFTLSPMSDRPANGSGNAEPALVDLDVATRRLMVALEALESLGGLSMNGVRLLRNRGLVTPDGAFATDVAEIEGLLAAPTGGLVAGFDLARVRRQLEVHRLPLDIRSEDGYVRLVAK